MSKFKSVPLAVAVKTILQKKPDSISREKYLELQTEIDAEERKSA